MVSPESTSSLSKRKPTEGSKTRPESKTGEFESKCLKSKTRPIRRSSTYPITSTPNPRAKRRLLHHPLGSETSISEARLLPPVVCSPNISEPDQSSFPDLRSGRHFAHPKVLEAATMQISSLSEFELSQTESTNSSTKTPINSSTSTSQSQQSEAECATQESEFSSCATTEFLGSPGTPCSQASTVAPWTPQRHHVKIKHGTGRDIPPVPDWFADVYESEDYDSETLAELAGLLSPRANHAVAQTSPKLNLSPIILPVNSSPGFSLVVDTARASEGDTWAKEPWPTSVRFITSQFNPRNWRFPRVSVGVQGGQGCRCNTRCNARSCENAKAGRFCTDSNCSFAGSCGNSLQEHPSLALSRNIRTGLRGITATYAIPAGEVLDQYLGHLQLLGPPCRNGRINEGYRMHLRTRTTGRKYVGIDALEEGGLLRFMNHSCNAEARFHEVQTGSTVTVVGVTTRDIFPGEEVTVSYGDRLWFVCRCGWWGCQHRDLQQCPQKSTPLSNSEEDSG